MSNKRIVKIVMENVKQLISDQLPALIEDAIDEIVHEKVDEELSQSGREKMAEVLDHIHKKHQISLDLLLRDGEEAYNTDICKGIIKDSNGTTRRCSFKAKCEGYCKFHKEQGERIQRRTLTSDDHFENACNEIDEARSELRDLGIF